MSAIETEVHNSAALAAIKAVHDMPFPAFSQRFLKIRTKRESIQPLLLNPGQLYIHEMAEQQLLTKGQVRICMLKARQWGGCLAPDTPVLTADLRWVPIAEVLDGDELVSCDESPGGSSRKMRTALVEKVWRTRKPTFRITLEDGRSVVCSADHRWLSRKSQTQASWRSIGGNASDRTNRSRLNVGDSIRTVSDYWGQASFDDAWFGGMIDGEGSFNAHRKSGGACLKVSQCDGPVLRRMQEHCTRRGYAHHDQVDNPRETMYGKRPVHSVAINSMRDLFQVLGRSRPTRFIGMRWWDGQRMPDNGWKRIVTIEPGPVMDLVDIQTSTGAFVANGLVSHNSTYIQGRTYRRMIQGPRGLRAMIVTHKADATSNIFGMTKRFHDMMDPRFRPVGRAGLNKLVFPKRDNSYTVATAGGDSIGHSDTVQILHASEFALWPDPEEAMTGAFNTVPTGGDTELWIESTGRGMGNAFHSLCMNARKGLGDFEFAFVPWFWFQEYERDPPAEMELDADDLKYMELHALTERQMAYRWYRILDLGGGLGGTIGFAQQYPATPEEAFSTNTKGSYIEAGYVMRARRATVRPYGMRVMGIDPAWQGKDRFSVVTRQGRLARKIGSWSGKRMTWSIGRCVQLIRQERPGVVFVDSNGVGAGIVDPLIDMQQELGCRVIIVMGGEAADDTDQYQNKAQECWGRMKGWFEQDQGVQIEDCTGKTEAEKSTALDAWQGDLTNPLLEYDANNRPRRESKQKMKTRNVPSPDDGDALAITFAFEVRAESPSSSPQDTEIEGYKRDEDGYRRRPPNWRAV